MNYEDHLINLQSKKIGLFIELIDVIITQSKMSQEDKKICLRKIAEIMQLSILDEMTEEQKRRMNLN